MVAARTIVRKKPAPASAAPGKTLKTVETSQVPLPVTVTPQSPDRVPRRKRLAKAFERPLDKVLKKKAVLVRDAFSFPEDEHAQLVRLKKQLAEEGINVKKGDLIRAGLQLLSSLSSEELKALVARISAVR